MPLPMLKSAAKYCAAANQKSAAPNFAAADYEIGNKTALLPI